MIKKILELYDIFSSNESLAHYGVHRFGNAGDNVLFTETRNIFDHFLNASTWRKEHVRKYVSLNKIKSINKKSLAIIVGGGGLMLKDTAANQNSGWQWNCPLESLNAINIPLIIFAIGYNRFNNQDDFDNIFRTHIIKTIEKSSFFGLRNNGSIKSLKEYIPSELHSKLMLQHCPTTLISYLYPKRNKNKIKSKHLAVNLAFDRLNSRYDSKEEKILNNIANAILVLQNKGWKIDYVKHSRGDEKALPYLAKNNIKFKYINLDRKHPQKILSYYQSMPITIGMRGHSQMIPFGMQNNIISLISHPKLKYFLDDINQPKWGIDIFSNNLTDTIIQKVDEIGYNNWDINNKNLIKSQNKIYEHTKKNFILIKKIINK